MARLVRCLLILFAFVPENHCGIYSSAICPKEFKDKCVCGLTEYGPLQTLQYVVNCTNSGFTDASMLKVVPGETEVLIFTGNKVADLPLNIFGKERTLDNLETIDLSNNHIQTIKGKTFHGVNGVKTLILDNNDLYVVGKDSHPRVFSNFLSLETLSLRNTYTEKIEDYEMYLFDIFIESDLMALRNLHLEHNELKMFHDEMFCPLKALRNLHLGANLVRGIGFNLSCLPHLRTLDLGDNMIPYLTPRAIEQLESLTALKVNLTGNPFDCSCQMVDSGTYRLFLRQDIKIRDKSTFHCSNGDVDMIGRRLFEAKLSACPKPQPEHSRRSTAGIAILGVIILLMCILLVGAAYMQRISVMIWARNCFARISSKGRYASLDKADEEKEMEV